MSGNTEANTGDMSGDIRMTTRSDMKHASIARFVLRMPNHLSDSQCIDHFLFLRHAMNLRGSDFTSEKIKCHPPRKIPLKMQVLS